MGADADETALGQTFQYLSLLERQLLCTFGEFTIVIPVRIFRCKHFYPRLFGDLFGRAGCKQLSQQIQILEFLPLRLLD